jgi:hypothetical protein
MPHKDPEKRKTAAREAQRRWRVRNPGAQKERMRQWRAENPERAKEIDRKTKAKNPEALRVRDRAWKHAHCVEISAKVRARRQSNSEFRMKTNLRNRVKAAMRGGKKCSGTSVLLAMELPEFRIYIQGQFRPGMTWENYGPVWHLDHVRPCASFDLTNPEEQKICFRWDNHQPLFAEDNLRKGDSCPV